MIRSLFTAFLIICFFCLNLNSSFANNGNLYQIARNICDENNFPLHNLPIDAIAKQNYLIDIAKKIIEIAINSDLSIANPLVGKSIIEDFTEFIKGKKIAFTEQNLRQLATTKINLEETEYVKKLIQRMNCSPLFKLVQKLPSDPSLIELMKELNLSPDTVDFITWWNNLGTDSQKQFTLIYLISTQVSQVIESALPLFSQLPQRQQILIKKLKNEIDELKSQQRIQDIKNQTPQNEINVVAFLDVILILFFITLYLLEQDQKKLDQNKENMVVQDRKNANVDKSKILVLSLSAEGELFKGKTKVEKEKLGEFIQNIPNILEFEIDLVPDRKAPYVVVQEIFNRLRKLGLNNIKVIQIQE